MVFTPGQMFSGYSQWVKASLEAYLHTLNAVQEQTEQGIGLALSQSDALHQEGKNFVNKWLEMSKGYQEDFRKILEKSLSGPK